MICRGFSAMPYFEYLGLQHFISAKSTGFLQVQQLIKVLTPDALHTSMQQPEPISDGHQTPRYRTLGAAQICFYLSACTNHSLGKEPHYLSCSFLCPPESLTIVSQELLSATQHTQISSWSTSGFEPTYGQSFVSSISYDSANIIYIWDLLGKISFIWIK